MVFCVVFRGYGKSKGKGNEKDIYREMLYIYPTTQRHKTQKENIKCVLVLFRVLQLTTSHHEMIIVGGISMLLLYIADTTNVCLMCARRKHWKNVHLDTYIYTEIWLHFNAD